jgi:hypothetical protein
MLANYVMKTARRAKSQMPVAVCPADTVWAAAAHAQRINGEYVK